MIRRAVALSAALLATACGGTDQRSAPAADSSAAAGPAIAAAPVATMGPNGCLHDGRWRPCSLKDRLEKSGLVVTTKPDTIRYDFLSVPGIAYTVGRGEVQAFFYDDTTKLAHDVAALDTVVVAPKGTLRHWDVHPTFVRSQNLVVILLTLSEQLMERGQLAIQGGAPQPDPPPTAPEPQQLPPTRVP